MNLNEYIDHTLLKADATADQIELLCRQAMENNFYCVCVNPSYVKTAKSHLEASKVKVATVVGFPLGSNSSKTKESECIEAIEDGADEIDMVINIGQFKSGNYTYCNSEISTLSDICHKENVILKVIIETALLTDDEIVSASKLCSLANADFVKTSTGFSARGASTRDIELIKEGIDESGKCGNSVKIKASGGIKDLKSALALIHAGADRLGVSSSMEIINDLKNKAK